MKILLTGANGYIGTRLLPLLVQHGHHVVCCVRDKERFLVPHSLSSHVTVIEVDFSNQDTLLSIPQDINAAYYLIHSMTTAASNFDVIEKICADNFAQAISKTQAKRVVYLSGIVNEKNLSKHLSSRFEVEKALQAGSYSLTTLRAGIIIGSGSASFEIIRDLVEKLPFMIAPKWIKTRCQPISIENVLLFLLGVLDRSDTCEKSYDIGGPDILSYKDMLLRFAKVRQLNRYIQVVPVLTPKLSSYWLYFVTATSYSLAKNLVSSMSVEVVCESNSLAKDLGIELTVYEEAIRLAFDKIDHNQVISSWKDALNSNLLNKGLSSYIQIPRYGCFRDYRHMPIQDLEQCIDKIWRIGGDTGWYYATFLWQIRGFVDQLFGGVGLKRGRRSATELKPGDTLDCWRVLYADKQEARLLLYAEMKMPGEAWLEFFIEKGILHQRATYRPRGVLGRLYWWVLWPFHGIIFNGMMKEIGRKKIRKNRL
jgi:uncharacterized protein YbjT (DUF2867 family)